METLLLITSYFFFATLFLAIILGGIALAWISIDIFKDFYRKRSRTLNGRNAPRIIRSDEPIFQFDQQDSYDL